LLALYQAIKKRWPIFKTSPYVKYAFTLENGPASLADLIYSVLNSNCMKRQGLRRAPCGLRPIVVIPRSSPEGLLEIR
jgi:hypothetical protein